MPFPDSDQIDAILRYLPILRRPGYLGSSGDPLTVTEKGVISMGEVALSEEMSQFMRDLYEQGFIVSFNWREWAEEGQRYVNNATLLNSASLETLQKLLTMHARMDRFISGGYFAEMISNGHMRAILERLSVIRREMHS